MQAYMLTVVINCTTQSRQF